MPPPHTTAAHREGLEHAGTVLGLERKPIHRDFKRASLRRASSAAAVSG